METSILVSTKKILGLDADYEAFDLDVITHINTVFATLNQLGVGPDAGFAIEDSSAQWGDFVITDNIPMQNAIKTFMYLSVRMIFDPPATSFALEALQHQIDQLAFRISVMREDVQWTAPPAPPPPDIDPIILGWLGWHWG